VSAWAFSGAKELVSNKGNQTMPLTTRPYRKHGRYAWLPEDEKLGRKPVELFPRKYGESS